MSFEAQKITGYASGIAALPDKVEGRAAWLKAQFDARTDSEVKTQHNALCDALAAPGAAASLGAQAPAGVAATPAPDAGAGTSVQAVLQGLADHAEAHAARADNPHGVTAAQLNAYTRAQTDDAIAARIVQIGAGDMAQSVYDPEGLGVPLLPRGGDGTQVTVLFMPVQPDEALCSGESLGVLFGKLAHRLAALADAIAGKAAAVHTHTKSEVGLGNVNNTADSEKSVKYAASAGAAVDQTARNAAAVAQTAANTAQTTANARMPYAGGTFTGHVAAPGSNTATWRLRNAIVTDSGWSPVSSNSIWFIRK